MEPPTESRLLRLAIARGLLQWEDLDSIADQLGEREESPDAPAPEGRWIPALVAAGRLSAADVAALLRELERGPFDVTPDFSSGSKSWRGAPGERPALDASSFTPEFRFLADWRRYRVERFLGAGGMGSVYKAFDPSLNRYVALKFLHRNEPELTSRFLREARSQARVDHPNVCQVHEVGEVEGRPYIAMQYIEGRSLAEPAAELPVERRVELVRDVARAIHAAHRTGLIHRDLKPGNILLAQRDSGGPIHPYVVDFGLAQDQDDRGLTRTGMISGTPAYISPEAAQGHPLDQRTDVYSLGVVLYELLAGEPPFSGANLAKILVRLVQEDPRPLRELSPEVAEDLETIVGKCLEKEPGRRFESAWALAEDLDRYLQGEPIRARPTGWLYRAGKRLRKHRALAGVSAAAVLALLILGSLALRSEWQARERAEMAQRFGQRLGETETAMRYAARLPLHDMTPEKSKLRRELAAIRAEMRRLGASAVGPGDAALGKGYLVLYQYETALEHLESAWDSGQRTPEVAAALGETLGFLYERSLAEANRSQGGEAGKAAAREEVERTYGRSALTYLRQGFGEEAQRLPYLKALIAFYEKRYPAAAEQAREAFRLDPELRQAARLEGQVYAAQGDEATLDGRYDEALRLYDRSGEVYRALLERVPSDASVHVADCDRRARRLATVLLVGDPPRAEVEGALAACDLALVVDPEMADALTHKSRIHGQIGNHRNRRGEDPGADLATAVDLAQRAIALNPRDASAYNNLATANRVLAEWRMDRGVDPGAALRRGLAAARKSVELQPGNAGSHSTLGTAYLVLVRDQQRRGIEPRRALELAAASFGRATAVNARYLPAYLNLATTWKTLAEVRIAQGLDPADALTRSAAALRQAVRLNPSSASLHNFLGNVHLTRSEDLLARGANPRPVLELAAESYGRAIALKPDYAFAHFNLGTARRLLAEALLEHGEDPGPALRAAAAPLAEALRLNPNDADVFLELAKGHLIAGRRAARQGLNPEVDLTRAEGDLLRAAALNPEQPEVFFTRALVERLRAERGSQALADAVVRRGLASIAKALAINPREARYLAVRGALQELAAKLATDPERRQGHAAEAVASLTEALRINPLLAREYGPVLARARL